MKLSSVNAKTAKPKDKPYKLSDGGGLFLLIKPNGGKYWRLKYRVAGKEKLLSIGVFPKISLKEAREIAAKARTAIKEGGDPSEIKRLEKLGAKTKRENSFQDIALEWLKFNHQWSANHSKRVAQSLERDVYPHLGTRPIAQITAPELLAVVRRVENRGAVDVASRILQRCGAVFRYAIQTGRLQINPASELSGVIKRRPVQHVPSITPDELPGLVRAIDGYNGHPITKYGLQFLLLTFVRPGELRHALWGEIDIHAKEWRIPAERMKMNSPHIVPLTRQALAVLEAVRPYSRNGRIFPGVNKPNQPMSENTLIYAIYRLGYKSRATAHGFRATASSLLNEQGFNADAIERQLSHVERNAVRGAYNHHARWMKERREMMEWWADYLEKVKA